MLYFFIWPQFSTITDPGATHTCAARKTASKEVPQPPGSTNPGSSGMYFGDLYISLLNPCEMLLLPVPKLINLLFLQILELKVPPDEFYLSNLSINVYLIQILLIHPQILVSHLWLLIYQVCYKGFILDNINMTTNFCRIICSSTTYPQTN